MQKPTPHFKSYGTFSPATEPVPATEITRLIQKYPDFPVREIADALDKKLFSTPERPSDAAITDYRKTYVTQEKGSAPSEDRKRLAALTLALCHLLAEKYTSQTQSLLTPRQ